MGGVAPVLQRRRSSSLPAAQQYCHLLQKAQRHQLGVSTHLFVPYHAEVDPHTLFSTDYIKKSRKMGKH